MRTEHGPALLLASAVVLLQLLAVLNPAVVEVDPEEMYNASHALELTRGHLSEAFVLQYRSFCGGCTLNALLGAALFTVLPPIWIVWKLVPVAFTVLLVLAAVSVVRRRHGSAGGWMIGGLLVLPAFSFAALSLIAWGNHYECGVIAALSVLVVSGRLTTARLFLLGVLLTGGVWIGFSALFALPAAGLCLLVRLRSGGVTLRLLGGLLAGLAFGLLPLGLQYLSTGASPLGEIYGGGEARPSLAHLPQQLITLLHPRQISGWLGAPQAPWTSIGFILSAALAAGLAIRRGPRLARTALVFLLSWGGIYLLSGFHIPVPPEPQIPTPAALRYLVPAYPLLVLLIGSTAASQWEHGQRRLPVVLLTGPLLVGLLSRAAMLSAPFPTWNAANMAAIDHDYFRQQASYMLPMSAHQQCSNEETSSRAVHAYGVGRGEAETALDGNPVSENILTALQPKPGSDPGAFYAGAASAVMERMDPDHRGDLESLGRIQAARWPDDGLRAVLRLRRHGSASWLVAIEGHDESSLSSLRAVLLDDPMATHAWWLIGLRWGEDTSRWLIPGALTLPDIELSDGIPEEFASGLGEAMGERWGPMETIPCPQNLPQRWEASFLAGYETGWQKRWSRRSQAGADTAVCTPPTSATR